MAAAAKERAELVSASRPSSLVWKFQTRPVQNTIRTHSQMRPSMARRRFRDAACLVLLTDSLFFRPRSVCPESLLFQSLEEGKRANHSSDSALEVDPVTPDVDLLLQCSFSYMHQGAECGVQEQKPEEAFLDPTAPEEDQEEVGFSFSLSYLKFLSSALSTFLGSQS